jgi:hypothetical protein
LAAGGSNGVSIANFDAIHAFEANLLHLSVRLGRAVLCEAWKGAADAERGEAVGFVSVKRRDSETVDR